MVSATDEKERLTESREGMADRTEKEDWRLLVQSSLSDHIR